MENETTVNAQPSLYNRLGGEPRLREIVDDVIDRIADNPFLEYYFRTIDKGQVKLFAYEYFSQKTGGPDPYTGPDPHRAFYSFNVRPEEYQYVLDDTVYILDDKGLDSSEKRELLGILEELRNEILRHPVNH